MFVVVMLEEHNGRWRRRNWSWDTTVCEGI